MLVMEGLEFEDCESNQTFGFTMALASQLRFRG
jgi:hypothetical protein